MMRKSLLVLMEMRLASIFCGSLALVEGSDFFNRNRIYFNSPPLPAELYSEAVIMCLQCIFSWLPWKWLW